MGYYTSLLILSGTLVLVGLEGYIPNTGKRGWIEKTRKSEGKRLGEGRGKEAGREEDETGRTYAICGSVIGETFCGTCVRTYRQSREWADDMCSVLFYPKSKL